MCNWLSLQVGWNIWLICYTSECFREPSSGRGSGFENLCPAPFSGSFELKFCSLKFWVASIRIFKQTNNTWNVTPLKTHGRSVGVLWLGKLLYMWVEWLTMPLHIRVKWWAMPLRIWIEWLAMPLRVWVEWLAKPLRIWVEWFAMPLHILVER